MRRLLVLVLALAASMTASIVSLVPASPASAMAGYEPLSAPQRVLDTRSGEPTVDGLFSGGGKQAAGSRLAVRLAGRAGLGSDLGAVVLNVTVDQPAGPGFVTVWPCDQPLPTTSNVNYSAFRAVGVAAITRVADDGTICLFTLAAAHLIVDVAGHFPADTFEALAAPERIADTRPGEPTIDGKFGGAGKPGAGAVYSLRVTGRGSVPTDATAAALTVTVTDVAEPGFVTVYPCDAKRPNASNVNYDPGSTTPNAVITRLAADGTVCIFTLRPVHLVVDIAGTVDRPVFEPLPAPRRLLDTRPGQTTIDAAFVGGGLQPEQATLQLDVAGRAGVPADATAVVLNVTSTGSADPGFVTVHPGGTARPDSSNVNYTDGRTVANMVVAALGPGGDVCLFGLRPTHLVVDVAGWLTGPPAATADAPCPPRTPIETAEAFREVLVRRPGLHRAVGVDRVGVYVCQIPTDSRVFDGSQQHGASSDDFAALARAEVAPWFDEVSGGRYAVEFTALGSFPVGRDAGMSDCIDEAVRRTGAPYTNTLVAGSTTSGGGFAGPGLISVSPRATEVTVFDRPPSESRRGGWVGGSVISDLPDPGTMVHEIGHTLHWPHSFLGPSSQYDNPVDVMSSGQGICRGGEYLYPCLAGNTLAFNRLASGWLRNGQVTTHRSGTVNYHLDAPNAARLQLIALPSPDDPYRAMTIEARPAVGNDDFLAEEGVALHIVDQVDRSGGLSGLSTRRIQRQATGRPDSFDHVVRLGGSLTVRGVTVEVLRRVGNRYDVRVTGTYRPPAGEP